MYHHPSSGETRRRRPHHSAVEGDFQSPLEGVDHLSAAAATEAAADTAKFEHRQIKISSRDNLGIMLSVSGNRTRVFSAANASLGIRPGDRITQIG